MKRKMVLPFSLTFLVLLLIVVLSVSFYKDNLLNEARLENHLHLKEWASAFEMVIKDGLSYIGSVEAYLNAAQGETEIGSNFESYAKTLLKGNQLIKNIAIAPNGIQEFVYPLEENEIVPGHNLFTDDRDYVREKVLETAGSEDIVMNGPYNLRQGGYGYIARKAVFLNNEFWGIISVVIDINKLLSKITAFNSSEIDIRLVGGEDNEIVFQTTNKKLESPNHFQLSFHNDTWEIYSAPINGWNSLIRRDVVIFAVTMTVIGILFLVLFTSLIERKEKLGIAVEKVTLDLNENQRKLKTLFKNLPGMAFRCKNDANWSMEIVSDGCYGLTGYTPEELISNKVRSYMDIVAPEDRAKVWSTIQNASNTGYYYDLQYSIITKSGERKNVIERGSHIRNSESEIIALEGVIFDVTKTVEMEEEVLETYRQLKELFNNVVGLTADMLEFKDPYTVGHQKNVSELAYKIGKKLNLPDERIEIIKLSGLLHDIGKTAIPTEFLTRPGDLADLEFQIIKEHPEIGFNLLNDLDFMLPIADIVHQHHERLDGSGYPKGIKGDEILLEARIIAVADVVDAMTSNRPYRPALGIEKAIEEIKKHSGTKYDSTVVGACLKVLGEN